MVRERGWEEPIDLDAADVEAKLWQQLKRPVRFGAGGDETLWMYRDGWYLAPAEAPEAAILDAVDGAALGPKLVGVDEVEARAGPEPDEARAPELESEREATVHVGAVGRLVWKRFIAEATDYAQQAGLEISHEIAPHRFSVECAVTVKGSESAVTRFEGFIGSQLLRYQAQSGA